MAPSSLLLAVLLEANWLELSDVPVSLGGTDVASLRGPALTSPQVSSTCRANDGLLAALWSRSVQYAASEVIQFDLWECPASAAAVRSGVSPSPGCAAWISGKYLAASNQLLVALKKGGGDGEQVAHFKTNTRRFVASVVAHKTSMDEAGGRHPHSELMGGAVGPDD